MIVKARCSNSKEWAFLEKYEVYRHYNRGYVKAITSVNVNGKLSPKYVFKGGEFVSVSDIDNSVGIDRYIKAKKPFYSKIKEGILVVLKAEVDFVEKLYYPEKSTYEVYTLNGGLYGNDTELPFKRVLAVPDSFNDIVKEPLQILGESFGNRELYIRRSMNG